MSENEQAFRERWELIKKSVIIGGIIALAISLFFNIKFGCSDALEFIQSFTILLISFWMIISPITTIVIMMIKRSTIGFAGGITSGLIDSLIGSISLNPFIMIFGLLKLFFYLFLIGIIAAIYIVYLPVSTIVYYVRYKKETDETIEVATNVENNVMKLS